MGILNYSSYAEIFEKGMSKPNMTKLVNTLLGILTDNESFYTIDGKLYDKKTDELHTKFVYRNLTLIV